MNNERHAFLLAILCADDRYRHPSYLAEKIDLAFSAKSPRPLEGALDSERLVLYREHLERLNGEGR